MNLFEILNAREKVICDDCVAHLVWKMFFFVNNEAYFIYMLRHLGGFYWLRDV